MLLGSGRGGFKRYRSYIIINITIRVNLSLIASHDYYQQNNVLVENRIQSFPWGYGPLTKVEIPNKHGELDACRSQKCYQ